MSAIDDLRIKVQSLTDQLRDATDKYNHALIEQQPLRIGHRVVNKKNDEAEISSIRVRYSEVEFYGRAILKSGKLHARERRLYEWDNWSAKS